MRLCIVMLGLLVLWWAIPAATGPDQSQTRSAGDLLGAEGSLDEKGGPQAVRAQSCDWSLGDPFKMHFPQLPDEEGWDVNATLPMVLADDFLCTKSGHIKDIHFWGSWKGDVVGDILFFVVSFHKNIPESPPETPYSRPGMVLWEMEVPIEHVHVIPIDPPTMEGWYDPSTGEVIPNDHGSYFQYNICLDEFLYLFDMFYQEEDSIYWLNISAAVSDPGATRWGWKNSNEHWMDDAVWGLSYDTLWKEIYEPEPGGSVTNTFWVEFGPDGTPIDGGGTGYYDDGTSFNGWFYYPNTDWWNIWFYDHPFDPDGYKLCDIYFEWYPTDPYYWIEVAANWATPDWPSGNPPPVPPLTPAEENQYIEREYLELYPPGMQMFGVLIPDYCPEWISIDFMGQNFIIESGYIEHQCISSSDSLSLDLAFVINSDSTCCNHDGIRGDANYDMSLDIGDLVYLVDYLFRGGPPPPCFEEGDVNGDGSINVADLTYMVDYLFRGGPLPMPCP